MADLSGLTIPIVGDASQFTTTLANVQNALRVTTSDIQSRLTPALDQIKSTMLAGIPATNALRTAQSNVASALSAVTTAQNDLNAAIASGNFADNVAARAALANATRAMAVATDTLNREAKHAADLEQTLTTAREAGRTELNAYNKQVSLLGELLAAGTISANEQNAAIEAARQSYAGSRSAADDYGKSINKIREQLAQGTISQSESNKRVMEAQRQLGLVATPLEEYRNKELALNEALATGVITHTQYTTAVEAARQSYAGSRSAADDYGKKIRDLNEQLANGVISQSTYNVGVTEARRGLGLAVNPMADYQNKALQLREALNSGVITQQEFNTGMRQLNATTYNTIAAFSSLIAVGIAGFFATAVYAMADFERSLNNIRVLAGNFNMDAAQDSIHALASEWGEESNKVTKGVAGLVKAGLSVDASFKTMDTIITVSKITGMEYEQVISKMIPTMMELGMVAGRTSEEIAKSAEEMANAYVLAAKAAGGSSESFAEAMGTATSGIRKLGASANEAMSVMMLYSEKGLGSGAAAGTMYNTMIEGLTGSVREHRDMWIELIGYDPINAVTGQYKSQTEIISTLSQKLNGMSKDQMVATLVQMGFGGAQIKAMLPLIQNTKALDDHQKALHGDMDAAKDAAQIMKDEFWSQLNQIKQALQQSAEVIGSVLLPIIKEWVTYIESWVKWIMGVVAQHKEMIVTIIAVVGTIASLISIVFLAVTALGIITSACATLGITVQALMGPLGWISLALGAIVGVAAYYSVTAMTASDATSDLGNAAEKAKKEADELKNSLDKTTEAMDDGISGAVQFAADIKKMGLELDKTISQLGMLEDEKQLWEFQRKGVDKLKESVAICEANIRKLRYENTETSKKQIEANEKQIKALNEQIEKNEKLLNQQRLKQRIITQGSNEQEIKKEMIAIQDQAYALHNSEMAAMDYAMKWKLISPEIRSARIQMMQFEKSITGEKAARDAVITLREEISTLRLTADAAQILALQMKGAGEETIQLARGLQGLKAHNQAMEDLRTKALEWNKTFDREAIVEEFKHQISEVEQAYKMGIIPVEAYHGKLREIQEEFNSKLGVKVSLEGLDTFDASSVKFLKHIKKMRQASLSGVKLETQTAEQVRATRTQQDIDIGKQLLARNKADEDTRSAALRTDITPEQRGQLQKEKEKLQGMHSAPEVAYHKSQETWSKRKSGIVVESQSEIDAAFDELGKMEQELQELKNSNASDDVVKSQQQKVDAQKQKTGNMFTQKQVDDAEKDMKEKRATWGATGDFRAIAEMLAPMTADEIVYQFNPDQVKALTDGMDADVKKTEELITVMGELKKAEEKLAELMNSSPEAKAAVVAQEQADKAEADYEELKRQGEEGITDEDKELKEISVERASIEDGSRDKRNAAKKEMDTLNAMTTDEYKKQFKREYGYNPDMEAGTALRLKIEEQMKKVIAAQKILDAHNSPIVTLDEQAKKVTKRKEEKLSDAQILAESRRKDANDAVSRAPKADMDRIATAQKNVADAKEHAASLASTTGTTERSPVTIPIVQPSTPTIPPDIAGVPKGAMNEIKEQEKLVPNIVPNIPSNIVSPTIPIQVPIPSPASRDPLAMTGKVQKDSEDKHLEYLKKIAENTGNSVTVETASLGP